MKAHAYLRGIAPKASAEDLNDLLWSCTSFPFGMSKDIRKVRRALRRAFHEGGYSIAGAIRFSHEDLDYQMDRHMDEKGELEEGKAVPNAPVPYKSTVEPKCPVVKAYSRALNKALKFRRVAEFRRLLAAPPASLPNVPQEWIHQLARQVAFQNNVSKYTSEERWVLMEALLDSALPMSCNVFYFALLSDNMHMLRGLIERDYPIDEIDTLHFQVMRQLGEGLWPFPEEWHPDMLHKSSHMFWSDFFPSRKNKEPPAFHSEYIMRMHALGASDQFANACSNYYGRMDKNDRAVMDSDAHIQTLALLVEIGWIKESVALDSAMMDNKALISEQMERVRLMITNRTLQKTTPPAHHSHHFTRL